MSPTTTISGTMTPHHKACDALWALAEALASEGRWPEAREALGRFVEAMEAHLMVEERLLFPAFEQATGFSQGPTQVMRFEHDQLRRLFEALSHAAAREDDISFSGAGETMLILMQQHNVKEEHMLYPACDEAVPGDPDFLEALAKGLGGA